MENAKKHWKILQKLETDFANRVHSFIVFGRYGEGLLVATENGEAFWLGEMEFGLRETIKATKPTQLDIPGHLVQMAHSDYHILLLNKQGEIYALGRNDMGQLGLGTFKNDTPFSPQLINYPYQFISVRCGEYHSLALTNDGKVYSWGSNCYGQVGEPSSSAQYFPFVCQIRQLDRHRIVAVECGGCHSLALSDQGVVYGWGLNYSGQLCDESESSRPNPIQIFTPGSVRSIAAGLSHTLLLTQTGEVWACGRNDEGQIGLPTTTKSTDSLVQVEGLPFISQILSHPLADLSIATTSNNQQCFVWGRLDIGMKISTPRELIPVYTNVESLLSFSPCFSTSHSVILPAKELSSDSVPDIALPANNHLLDRIGKMFNNPESSPDVRFQLTGDQSILAHRSILQISSGHFHRLFCSPTSSVTSTPQSDCSSLSRYTTNPSEPDSNSTLTTSNCPIQVTIPISDHSYPTFHAYLRFLYLGILEVAPEHLVDLFSLSVAYLELDLQQLCLSRMRSTLTPSTSCLFYQLTLQHSLPELGTFQQELVKFISDNFREVIDSDAYKSMDAELCKQLTFSMAKLSL